MKCFTVHALEELVVAYPVRNDSLKTVLKLFLESIALKNINNTHVYQHSVFLHTTLNVPFPVRNSKKVSIKTSKEGYMYMYIYTVQVHNVHVHVQVYVYMYVQ